ncbi:sulfide:quinone oxidoreductase, mitochondrial-like [Asterias amurensis]|uniref:sulfide:quinone oxidoreductase, mitochondrial-like n=1 Tax=Asterias amurensis TaxID=7602 RepID=UPI003AB216AE
MAFCFEAVTSLSRCLRFTTSLPRLQVSHARSIQSEPAELPLSPPSTSESMYNFVVVGGGSGGLALASNLSRKYGKGQVAVVEPSDEHFYQPLWTLVGGGQKKKEQSRKLMKDVMPGACDWIKDKAVKFDPENNSLTTAEGKTVQYNYLVVAMGMQLNFDKLKGLVEALEHDPQVCCNYSYHTVDKTFQAMQNFKSGNAIFTFPNTPVKCAGAPQKIMYLAEEYFRENDKRDGANVMYFSPLGAIFSAPKYAAVMNRICKERGIQVNLKHNLVEIKPDTREAVFANLNTDPNELITVPYAMLHVPPPMGPPDILKASPLAGPSGFLSVSKDTGQHTKYPNVFGIGDCTDFPTSKTAAAIAGQSGILLKTINAVVSGLTPYAKYNGYTSCPLVTGRRSCVLAEFDYTLEPLETFPVDQSVERRTAYHMKADLLPTMYWNGLIKGIWHGPGMFRKLLHLGFSK